MVINAGTINNFPYYDKKVSIYRQESVEIRGSSKLQKTLIYDKIDCSYWEGTRPNYLQTPISALTDDESYEINIKPINTNVRQKDICEVFYNDNGTDISIGKFIVNTVLFNENSKVALDNISLQVRTIDNVKNSI